jgi:hypothetical protein
MPSSNPAHMPERNDEWEDIVVTGATEPNNPDAPSHDRYWHFQIARASDPGGQQWEIRRPDDMSSAMFREALETKKVVRIPTVELEQDTEQVQTNTTQ